MPLLLYVCGLIGLKRSLNVTAEEIAKHLDIHVDIVRKHLKALEAKGLIEIKERKG